MLGVSSQSPEGGRKRLGNAVVRFAPAIHRLSACDERDSL